MTTRVVIDGLRLTRPIAGLQHANELARLGVWLAVGRNSSAANAFMMGPRRVHGLTVTLLMSNPYQAPLTPPEPPAFEQPPPWRRGAAIIVHVATFVVCIFASLASMWATGLALRSIEKTQSPSLRSLAIMAVVGISVGVLVQWVGTAAAKRVARGAGVGR